MSTKKRIFIAVTPPSEILDCIGDIKEKIRAENENKSIRWVNRNNLHITLKFIGDIPNEKTNTLISLIGKTFKNTESFEVKTGKIVIFPDKLKPRVVAIGIHGETLDICAEKINDALLPMGIDKERRRFNGHITLGRVKKKLKKSLKTDQITEERKFTVDEIRIVESLLKPQGAEYHTLKRIMLN